MTAMDCVMVSSSHPGAPRSEQESQVVGSARGDRSVLALLLLVSSLPRASRVGQNQSWKTVPTSEFLGSSKRHFSSWCETVRSGGGEGGQSAVVGIRERPEVAGVHGRLLLLHALGAVRAIHGGIDGVGYDLTVCPFPTTAGLERRDRMRWPCRCGAADHPAPPGDCLAHAASWWHSAPPRSPQQRSTRIAECRRGSAARPS